MFSVLGCTLLFISLPDGKQALPDGNQSIKLDSEPIFVRRMPTLLLSFLAVLPSKYKRESNKCGNRKQWSARTDQPVLLGPAIKPLVVVVATHR